MYSEFYKKLTELSDEKIAEFSKRTIPCSRPFMGVKIPEIRKLVKEIPLDASDEFLAHEPVAVEEVLARGFMVARLSYEKMISVFDSQVEYLDNWAAVDTFLAALRNTVKGHEKEFFETKISLLLKSNKEYAARAGVVSLLDFYVSSEWLATIFNIVEEMGAREEYYVRMAVAWLVSECFIKFPEETLIYMKGSKLPAWTYNKAISKICDSFRVSKEDKDTLKKMRRKNV